MCMQTSQCQMEHEIRVYVWEKPTNIVKCDGNWKNAWWLYEEIYDTDRGFELHILLRQQMRNPKDGEENLMELTIQAEDIMFNSYDSGLL